MAHVSLRSPMEPIGEIPMPTPTFVGGPYDGLQPVDWMSFRLGDEVEIPISISLLHRLNGEFGSSDAEISGVAIYRFTLSKNGIRFLFGRRRIARPEERSRLEAWHRDAVERAARNEHH